MNNQQWLEQISIFREHWLFFGPGDKAVKSSCLNLGQPRHICQSFHQESFELGLPYQVVFNILHNSGVLSVQGFFGPCLTSKLCQSGTMTDWTRNIQTRREGDFGSDRDSNHWSRSHDFSSSGDPVYHLSVIPSVSLIIWILKSWYRRKLQYYNWAVLWRYFVSACNAYKVQETH